MLIQGNNERFPHRLMGEEGISVLEEMLGVAIATDGIEQFEFYTRTLWAGVIQVTRFRGTQLHSTRQRVRHRQRRIENLLVGVVESGGIRLEQNHRQNVIMPGALSCISEDVPFSFGTSPRTAGLLVEIPLELLGSEKDSIRRCASEVFPRTPLAISTISFIHSLYRSLAESGEDRQSHETSLAVTDIIRSLLAETAGRQRVLEDIDGYVLDRIKRSVRAQYRNPLLAPEAIAAEVGISVRSLFRRFEKLDTSFRAYVETLRVKHAGDLLKYSILELSEIAGRSGFGTTTKMRRAFVRHFGKTPSEVREMMQRGSEARSSIN